MIPDREILLRESESMLRLSVGISISGVDRAPRSGKLEIATCDATDHKISMFVQNHC